LASRVSHPFASYFTSFVLTTPLLCAVDVPTRTYIFAPQPEKLQLSEKEAQGWVDAVTQLIGNNQRRRKQVQKVGTLTKKKKKREEKPAQEPSRLQSVSQELEPLSPRADASARMSRSQPAPSTSSSSSKKGSSRHSREKEKEGESKERDRGDREREKKEEKDKDRKSRHRTGSKDKRSPDPGGAKPDGKARTSEREKAKSELKRIDEERKAEIGQVVEKYLKKRDAIIEALIAKEISLIVESHEHEKQAILDQIKVKSIQL